MLCQRRVADLCVLGKGGEQEAILDIDYPLFLEMDKPSLSGTTAGLVSKITGWRDGEHYLQAASRVCMFVSRITESCDASR